VTTAKPRRATTAKPRRAREAKPLLDAEAKPLLDTEVKPLLDAEAKPRRERWASLPSSGGIESPGVFVSPWATPAKTALSQALLTGWTMRAILWRWPMLTEAPEQKQGARPGEEKAESLEAEMEGPQD
jgi:hypothetical protein